MSEELKISADMFPVAGWEEAFDAKEAGRVGAFFFSKVQDGDQHYEQLVVVIPDHGPSRAEIAALPLRPGQPRENRASWEFDGNRERPTLTPSVHRPGVWHGYVTAGRLVSC